MFLASDYFASLFMGDYTREGDLPLIVAIDLQPMAPIEGVIQVQGDITNARTAEVVLFSYGFGLLYFLPWFVLLQLI